MPEDSASVKKAIGQFKSEVKATIEKRRSFLLKEEKVIRKKMNTAPFVRMQDQFTFVLSIFLMILFTYLYGRETDPRYFTFVSTVVPTLVLLRVNSYYSQGWHYYLIDFCYFATACMLFLINAKPDNEGLFKMVFLYSNGCLGIAIAAFRNSLVFHRIDYITSLGIHVVPMLTSVKIRWFIIPHEATLDPSQRVWPTLTAYNDQTVSNYLWQMFVCPALGYLTWATFYCLVTFVFKAKRIKEKNYDNSFNYFAS
jgi:hypothetical protein